MGEPVRSSVPLHHQIAQVLRLRLESGAWSSGSAPATEQSLCEEFGVSRSTVRQALGHLKHAGLLESRRGVGTRGVASPAKRKFVRASGDPLHASLNSRARVVALGVVPSPPAVATFFRLDAGAPIWHFVRVHHVDAQPLSVVNSYLPAHLGAAFNRTSLQQQPMHELLWQRFGLRQKRSMHAIRVARADVDIASMLGIALAEPVLRIQSSVYLDDGQPIRWTENSFREDRYEYLAEMTWPTPGQRHHSGTKRAAAAKRTKLAAGGVHP